MSDGQIKRSAAGKLLKTAAGLLKVCQCCTTDTEVLYRKHLSCCNQCKEVYFRTDVFDDCVGAPGSSSTVLKWRGKCYLPLGTSDTFTLAEAEATGRPVVVDNTEVTCLPYATCSAAQAAGQCPACSECCLRWYPSKACLVGDIPSNPQNSVCCNLGRQAKFISTCTFVDYAGRTGLWFPDASGCHFTEDRWVITKNDAWSESTECRWRATCPVGSPCIALTLNTRTRSGVGVPAPGPGTSTADCSVTTTGACTARAVVPSQRSFCNASRPDPCLPFTCTGDATSYGAPSGSNLCNPASLDCGGSGCAGCFLDAYPCYSREVRYSWSCYRSCRSGNWSSSTNTIYRPYAFVDGNGGWYCPGEPCEAQIIGVCEERYNATVASVCEWEFIVEDEEGCLSDNTCFQYNGQCLEATEGLTTPDEICSDPECEPPPGEEMAPLMAGSGAGAPVFDPDSAGGGF